ncbi:hypothetical protein SUGI_0536210 [Cryptomeria japonica]|nr:hypothetical protein SUGI_0536210 [Cryptomeria japonica]
MLLKVPTLISSFSGVECTLTELFRRFLTGGLAVVIFFLNIVPEASGNNLTTPPHASYDCEDVSHYYSSLECLKEEELMEKMHVIISPHHSIPYKQVWDALRELDAVDIEHPNDSPNVIEIYSQKAVPKALAGKLEGWNREHLWPRSYGLITEPELTDLHNLHPADMNVNSSRGNKYYGECVPSSSDCLSPANPEAAPDTATDKESWMPPAKVRGDIARSVMYMAICYGFNQPPGSHNLQLSDSPSMVYRSCASLVADTNLGLSIYTIFLPTDSLQNGPADGIALIEEGNGGVHVIHFVSYEGVVEAVEGPLQGLKSEDIGVSESKASSSQDSLGLTGPTLENFHWTKFVNGASPGKLNKGQNIFSQRHNRVLDHKD